MLSKGYLLHNRYEILDIIGSGGMAVVYKAKCNKLNRLVAIKVLKEEFYNDENLVLKFKKEAQACAILSDHNIVNIYDVIIDDNIKCIVMEYVPGITLKTYIDKKGILDIKEAIGIAMQIASGLKAAHDAGIVHRDIKPQNIIISSNGKIKVADFGIATAINEDYNETLAVGSVHYISPEQAMGNMGDNRSDIYSLGITLYEMLSATVPFDDENLENIVKAHINTKNKSISLYNQNISTALEKIINKCIEKNPNKRYQDVSDLIYDLKNVLNNDYLTINSSKNTQETTIFKPISVDKKTDNYKNINDEDYDTNDEDKSEKITIVNKLIVGLQFFIAISVVAILLFFLSKFVPFLQYNKTNEVIERNDTTTTVPDLTNLNYNLAQEKLKNINLQLKIVSEEYNDNFPKDTVISQEPEYGTNVDKYSIVNVIISRGEDSIDLNSLNLINQDVNVDTIALKDKGLNVITSENFSDTIEKGKVISFYPQKVKKGDTVNIVVSKGNNTEIVMPDLIGLTQAQALSILHEYGLTENNITQEYSNEYDKGTVIKQSEEPASNITKDKLIDLVISKGKKEVDYKYVASINSNCDISGLIGPGSGLTEISVTIKLKQIVDGKEQFTTLMEPRTVSGDTILPVRFKYIEGVYGVDKGSIEVIETKTGNILKSYDVDFFKVQ